MNNLHLISIPTPFPVGPVNVYLLGGPVPTLVDTGPDTDEAMACLRAGLAVHGYALSDLHYLVITHAHPDHYGLAARVAAESGARVCTHRYNQALLANGQAENRPRRAYYAQVLRQAGVPVPVVAAIQRDFGAADRYSSGVTVGVALDDKECITLGGFHWQVIHTPGHARGHICLYHQPSGYLLSGDHLLRDISSNPILESPLPGETERPHSLAQYICSLERVAALELTVAWPGHGAPVTDPQGLIAQRLRFHQERVEQVATVLAEGPKTAFQIATVLFPWLQGIQVFLAISEVIGHLDILQEERRVVSQLAGDVILYTLTTVGDLETQQTKR